MAKKKPTLKPLGPVLNLKRPICKDGLDLSEEINETLLRAFLKVDPKKMHGEGGKKKS